MDFEQIGYLTGQHEVRRSSFQLHLRGIDSYLSTCSSPSLLVDSQSDLTVTSRLLRLERKHSVSGALESLLRELFLTGLREVVF